MKSRLLVILFCSLHLIWCGQTARAEATPLQDIQAFAREMAEKGFVAQEVEQLLLERQPNQTVLKHIKKPAEALPWYRYKQIFITEKRIDEGVQYYRQHLPLLQKVSHHFAVEPEYLVAIMGVETFYGKHQGNFAVLDALYTLAFHYPKRSRFFRAELAQFLQLTREQKWTLSAIKGSYAGAMGMGQFISSSYRHYGVDFDGDGKVNLFTSHADMLASIANYFKKHGWKRGQMVAHPLPAESPLTRYASSQWRDPINKSQLHELDAKLSLQVNADRVAVLSFREPQHKEFLLAGNNFYTITRYNRSPLYARAVWSLAQAIKDRVEGQP